MRDLQTLVLEFSLKHNVPIKVVTSNSVKLTGNVMFYDDTTILISDLTTLQTSVINRTHMVSSIIEQKYLQQYYDFVEAKGKKDFNQDLTELAQKGKNKEEKYG